MAKILVVEDDVQLADVVGNWLIGEHHLVERVYDGDDALSRMKVYDYDLIVLDWGLPKKDGIEVLNEFRKQGGRTPVLMLTGRNTVNERISGLDSGADDYLTKPFHGKELIARVKALLRRSQGERKLVLVVGQLELNCTEHTLKVNGEGVKLVPKEFELLEFFMRNPGQVFSSERLISQVWSSEGDATNDALNTCLKRLRKKIDGDKSESMIRNVHGVGFGIFED